MAYLGRSLDRGNYLKLDDLQSQFNGSTKTFNLTSGGNAFYPGSAFSILVSLGGVVQEPESAYTININTITFAIAPGASDDFFCIVLGVPLGIGVPADGTVTGSKFAKPFNYDNGLLYLDDTNNRVGVNSLTPGYSLDVNGDINFNGIFYQNGSQFVASRWTAGAGTTIYRESYVGIGTTIPTSTLTVGGATSTSTLYVTGISTFNNTLNVVPTSTSIAGLFSGTTSDDMVRITQLGTGNALVVEDSANPDSTPFVVTATGSVGVGVTNPGALLDVGNITTTNLTAIFGADTNASTRTDATTKIARIGIPHYTSSQVPAAFLFAQTTSVNNVLFLGGGTALMNAATLIDFYTASNTTTTSGTLALRIDNGQRVGIGTDVLSARLNVVPSSTSIAGLFSGTTSDDMVRITQLGTGNALVVEDSANPDSTPFVVKGDGSVGVGTTNPTYKLQVVGSFGATTKSFIIDHPTKEGKKLQYGSLESPYHGIRLTGSSIIKNGISIIELPEYIHNLVKEEGVNIHITNIKHGKILWVEEVNIQNNQFTIMTEETNGEYEFYWDFTAIRKDVEDMEVEL